MHQSYLLRIISVTTTVFISLFLCFLSTPRAHAQKYEWLQHMYSQADRHWGSDMATDSKGNVYVAGNFSRRVTINDSLYKTDFDGSYITKFSSSGDHLQTFIIEGLTYLNSLAIDESDHLYTCIYISNGNAVFDGLPLYEDEENTSGTIIIKISPNGDLLWFKNLTEHGWLHSGKMVCYKNEALYVSAVFPSQATFGDSTFVTEPRKGDSIDNDIVLFRMDTSGAVQWARHGNGRLQDFPRDIAVDEEGNCYALWDITDQFRVGDSLFLLYEDWSTRPGVNENVNDAVLVKYDPKGNFLFAKQFGSRVREFTGNILVRQSGEVLVCGTFPDTMWFSGEIYPSSNNPDIANSKSAIFITTFSSNGTVLKLKKILIHYIQPASMNIALAEDVAGSLYAALQLASRVYFDSVEITPYYGGAFNNFLVLQFDSNYAPIWHEAFSGNKRTTSVAITANEPGNVTVLGNYVDILALNDPSDYTSRTQLIGESRSPGAFLVHYTPASTSVPISTTSMSTECDVTLQWQRSGANGVLSIESDRPTTARVTLYDVAGKQVTTFLDNETIEATHSFSFDVTDYPSGQYFFILTTDDCIQSLPITVTR